MLHLKSIINRFCIKLRKKKLNSLNRQYVNYLLLLSFMPIWEFFSSVLADGLPLEFEWQQVSLRTLLSILADRNNVTVLIASSRPLISKSSIPCTNPLMTVSSTSITIGITVTFIFHSFSVLKQGRDTDISFSFLSLLLCYLLGQQSPLFGRFSLFCWLSPGLVVWPRLNDPFVSPNPR